MRTIAPLAFAATLLCAACATEAGNPGPVSNPNPTSVVKTAVVSPSNTTPVEQPALQKIPEAAEFDPWVSESVDEDVPLQRVKTKLEADNTVLAVYSMDGEGAMKAKADKVKFNDPVLEIVDYDGLTHRWRKEK